MSLSKLPYDVQLKIFQHVPETELISSETVEAQSRIYKQYPRFDSEDSLASFDDWNLVKECDVSDSITSESKKLIYSKLLSKSKVKSFQILNKWRAELVADCKCHFKRLKVLYIADMDIEKVFSNITVDELTISGNKWNQLSPEVIKNIKSKCKIIIGPSELLKLFE
eukprot:NODE_996_length_2759_cov_1.027820.p3 type:complete len:167 gc:universal NODE_996_length_2759_cov_1.027820:956-1456(+)